MFIKPFKSRKSHLKLNNFIGYLDQASPLILMVDKLDLVNNYYNLFGLLKTFKLEIRAFWRKKK